MKTIFQKIKERKEEKETEARERMQKVLSGEIVNDAAPSGRKKHKSSKAWIFVLIIGAALIVAVIYQMGASINTSLQLTSATVYSKEVSVSDIDTVVPGAGTLAEEESSDIELIEGIETAAWYVSNGDTVSAGDVLAKVDTASVMSSIAEIQSKLDSLDEEINEAKNEESKGLIAAAAAGRVMEIYAKEDTSIIDTMYENSALMLISLDGYLSIPVSAEGYLSVGDQVNVTLEDSSVTGGKVGSIAGTSAVILVSDAEASYGEKVSVSDTEGELLGEGSLGIHSCLIVTGYAGTVSEVNVSVGDAVAEGDTLLTLSDTDYSGTYEKLLALRSSLTEAMRELFILYQDPYIYAESDGVISGIEDDGSGSLTSYNEEEPSAVLASAALSYTKAGTITGTLLGSVTFSETEDPSDGDEETPDLTETPEASETPGATESPTPEASETPTPEASETPTPEASETPTPEVSETPTPEVSETPTPEASETPTPEPTETPTPEPTETPTPTPEKPDTNQGGSVSGYVNLIGKVVSIEAGTDSNTLEITLKALPGTHIVNDYGQYLSGSFNEEELTETVTVSVSAFTVMFDYGQSSLKLLTASAIGADDYIALAYSSSELDDPVWIVRFSEETSGGGGTGWDISGSGTDWDFSGSDIGGDSYTFDFGDIDINSLASGTVWSVESMDGFTGSIYNTADIEEAMEAAAAAAAEEALSYTVSKSTYAAITPQEKMTIAITVDELDILSLKAGQAAAVTLDAFPGQSFEGTVTAIDVNGTNSGGNTKYTVEITIGREEGMLAGMNASAKITISTTEGVPVIPEDALVEEDGAVYVYTSYDEKTETLGGLTPVTTGISDGENVEITSGLSEGDTYYYSILDVYNYDTSTYSGNGGFMFGRFGGGR